MKKSWITKRRYILAAVLLLFLLVLLSPVVLSREYEANEKQSLVALTFDDGRKNWLSHIMPVLEHYKLPATGFINSPDFLKDFTWYDIETLYKAGWEIGWHTAQHIDLRSATGSAITSDFDTVESLFNEHGLPAPVSFAYPWGNYDRESKEIVAKYFEAARTLLQGVNHPSYTREHPHRLKSFKLQAGLSFFETTIKDQIGRGSLLVFMGHAVGYVEENELEISEEDFENLARFLYEQRESGEIDVVSFSEGVKRVCQRDDICSWRFKIESPFEPWGRAYGIPIPNRVRQLYEIFQRD